MQEFQERNVFFDSTPMPDAEDYCRCRDWCVENYDLSAWQPATTPRQAATKQNQENAPQTAQTALTGQRVAHSAVAQQPAAQWEETETIEATQIAFEHSRRCTPVAAADAKESADVPAPFSTPMDTLGPTLAPIPMPAPRPTPAPATQIHPQKPCDCGKMGVIRDMSGIRYRQSATSTLFQTPSAQQSSVNPVPVLPSVSVPLPPPASPICNDGHWQDFAPEQSANTIDPVDNDSGYEQEIIHADSIGTKMTQPAQHRYDSTQGENCGCKDFAP